MVIEHFSFFFRYCLEIPGDSKNRCFTIFFSVVFCKEHREKCILVHIYIERKLLKTIYERVIRYDRCTTYLRFHKKKKENEKRK